jgi:hypothetical protein
MVEATCMEEEFAVPDPPPAKSSYTPRVLFHTLQGYPPPDVHDEPDEDMLDMDEGDPDPPQETSAVDLKQLCLVCAEKRDEREDKCNEAETLSAEIEVVYR